jgi:hypothetical protein
MRVGVGGDIKENITYMRVWVGGDIRENILFFP